MNKIFLFACNRLRFMFTNYLEELYRYLLYDINYFLLLSLQLFFILVLKKIDNALRHLYALCANYCF